MTDLDRIGRRMPALRLPLLALCLLTALLHFVPPAVADDEEPLTSATPSIIDGLRESAAKARAQVEEELKRAGQWRDLAASARQNAAKSQNPDYIKSWNEDAAYNDKQAQQLEDNAKSLQEKATADEARADRLTERVKQANAPKPAAPAPTAPSKPAQPSMASALAMQADWQESKARDLADLAGRWNGAANHLVAQIPKTDSAARQAALRETADLYYAQGRKLAADAQDTAAVAKALRDQAKYTPPDLLVPEEDSEQAKVPPPEAFEGRWAADGSEAFAGRPITIHRVDERSTGFVLDTGKREWNGYYDDAPKPRNGRIWFWHKPDAKAINLDIPDWARRQVDGRLEWRLVFDTDEICGTQHITAKWFPGEVTWDEVGRKSWVTGVGEPIEIKYTRTTEAPEEVSGEPSIYPVTPAKVGSDYMPIRSVPRGMPFRVRAVLPSELGSITGGEMTALMTGANGDFAVKLTGVATEAGPWVYTSAPIQFERYRGIDERLIQGVIEYSIAASKGMTGGVSFGSLTREAASNAATFKTADGEVVNIKYGKANSGLAVFDNVNTFGVYQIRRTLNDQDIALRTVALLDPAGPNAAAIRRKLEMILNARTFLAYSGGDWPAQMGNAVGLQYLRLLKMSDDRKWDVSTLDEGENDQGVVYQTTIEKNFVEARIGEVRDKSLDAYLTDLIDRLKSGIDEKKAINQYLPFDVEDVKITFMGEDWAGQPVDRLTRVLAGTRLTLEIFVNVAGVYAEPAAAKGVARVAGVEAELGAMQAVDDGAGNILSRMSSMEKPSDILEIPVKEADGIFPRIQYGAEPSPAQIRASMEQKLGTKEFELLPPTQGTIDQAAAGGYGYCVRSGCAISSIVYVLQEAKIAKIAADTLHSLLRTNFGINVVLQKGANMLVVRDILEGLYGAKATFAKFVEVQSGPYQFISDALGRGSHIIAKIKYASGELHAVVITGLDRAGGAAKGAITHVKFFDVNAGSEVRMSCKLFDEKYLMRSANTEAMKAKEFGSARRIPELLEVAFQ